MSKRRELERLQLRKKKRLQLIIGISVSACLVAAVVFLIATSQRPVSSSTAYVSVDSNGDLRVPRDSLHSNLNYINYGGSEEMLLWEDGDGLIRTALDTCVECYPMGYVRFTLRGDTLTCSACGTTQSVTGLGTEGWHGCKPISITPEMREDTDSDVVIPASALAFAEDMFGHWDLSDFGMTFESYLTGEPHTH